MTDLETAIMIKNMAREMVRRASAKNALKAYKVIGKRVNKETNLRGLDLRTVSPLLSNPRKKRLKMNFQDKEF